MAEAVVALAVKTIGKLLIDERNFLHGIIDQAELLQTKLNRMRWFLKDAEARQGEEDRVREWISEIREIAYEAEIMLQIYALKVASRRKGGIIKNVIKRFSCILWDSYNRHKVGLEIQNLITKISDLTESFQNYGVRAIMQQESSSRSRLQEIRRTYSRVADDFIELGNEIETLVNHVIGEDEEGMKRYRVISICGMGGLGKTTLARKVYNHPKVRRHFDGFAWVCISQQWQTKDLLRVILLKLVSSNRQEIQMWTIEEMVTQISQIQQTQKCFIVLDDIWSVDAWECIKHAFPFGEKCIKILLTTRNKEVASHIGPDGFHHQPRFLSRDESWELLQKKAFRLRRHEVDSQDIGEMKELGKKMVEHCGGLPLAVVVLGGILATKQSLRDWKNVYHDIRANLGRGNNVGEHQGQVQKILELSYNDLPYQLKPCFLYLGQYPEDSDIDTESLYQRWIAEEMVSIEDRTGDESMMEVAEKYLRVLAQRYLVEVVEEGKHRPRITRFRPCRLHDLIRELCLHKAKEENLFTLVNYGDTNELGSIGSLPRKVHRLIVLMSDERVPEFVPPEKKVLEHLRSLQISVSPWYESRIPKKLKNYQFNSFQLLKVLIIEGLQCDMNEGRCNCFPNPSKTCDAELMVGCSLHQVVSCGAEDAFRCLLGEFMLPKGFGKLKNLRYFSLQDCGLWMLPSSIGNLEHLETLDLRWTEVVTLPNMLWKMKGLRHLYLPRHRYNSRPCKVELGELTKLEILGNFRNEICEAKDLWKLINLRELHAIVDSELEFLEEIINYISNSNHISFVTLVISDCELETEKGSQILARMLSFVNLHVLCIEGSIHKLPVSYDPLSHFSTSLIELKLTSSKMEEDPMEILGKFPTLRRLDFFDEAFVGKEMICSKMSFPVLKVLQISQLNKLEKWRVEEGAMPNLSRLVIVDCPKLEKIPEGMRFVTTLKELEIIKMPAEFESRVRIVNGEEGEDFDQVSHVPSITIRQDLLALILEGHLPQS